MPVDAEPDSAGKFVLEGDGDTVHARFRPGYSGPRHQSHFSTCPNADQHRRK